MINKLLKGLLLIVTLAMSGLVTHANETPTPVTGNVQSILGAATTSNAFVRFRLRNFSGYVPRIIGIGALNITSVDVVPDNSGNVTTTLWGNDIIIPGPNITYYTFEFWSNGKMQASEDFLIVCTPVANTCTSPTFNFNSATPLSAPPIAPNAFPVLLNPIGSQNIVEPPGLLLSINGNIVASLVGPATPGHCPVLGSALGTIADGGSSCGGTNAGFPFNQVTPATPWVINHNLNGVISVSCFDAAGDYFIPDSIVATSANVLTITPPSGIQTGSCFIIGPGAGVITTNILPLNNQWTGNETHSASETF